MRLTVDPDDTTLLVETSDLDLAGEEKFWTVKATLTDYPTLTLTKTGKVIYVNPCNDATLTVDQTVVVLPDYMYDNSALVYTSPVWTVTPSLCPLTYSCFLYSSPVSSTAFDCDTAGVTSFDATNVVFTLTMGIDVWDTYKQGDYSFRIRATTFGSSQEIEFKFTLFNLCKTATINLVDSPFAD